LGEELEGGEIWSTSFRLRLTPAERRVVRLTYSSEPAKYLVKEMMKACIVDGGLQYFLFVSDALIEYMFLALERDSVLMCAKLSPEATSNDLASDLFKARLTSI
jgi:hypothetical protein